MYLDCAGIRCDVTNFDPIQFAPMLFIFNYHQLIFQGSFFDVITYWLLRFVIT